MSNKSNCSDELNNLLQNLSSRLGAKPEELKSAAQKGNINNIIKGLNLSDAEKIQKVLSDKEASKKILSSPQAQKAFEEISGREIKMEDLAGKLTEILNDPNIMNQIKDFVGSSAGKEDNSDDKKKQSDTPNSNDGLGGLPPDMVSTIMKLAPILSSVKNDDKYTSFLRSLRPLLSKSRQKN